MVLSKKSEGGDIVACFISSVITKKKHNFDILIQNTSSNFIKTGLKKDSLIKVNKIATLDKKIVLGEIGLIDTKTQKEVDRKIKCLFGF